MKPGRIWTAFPCTDSEEPCSGDVTWRLKTAPRGGSDGVRNLSWRYGDGWQGHHSRRLYRCNSFPPGFSEESRRSSFAGVIVVSTPRVCIVIYIVSGGRDEYVPCRALGLRRGDER